MSHRRKKCKKQSKIIVVLLIGLLCIMGAGYAAFQTNLNINVKGNIKRMFASEYLKKKCNQTTGDGLYKDTYENDRCIYRGANPENYIKFGEELWRIVSIESNGTVKIIKNTSVGLKAFDNANYRTTGYCLAGANYGCNAWMAMNSYTNTNFIGDVDKDASINIYLNNDYYNSLDIIIKENMVPSTFNVGAASYNEINLGQSIIDEKRLTWNGKIGLLSISEFVRGSINEKCTSVNAYLNNSECYSNSSSHNYLFDIITSEGKNHGWLITPYATNRHDAFLARTTGVVSSHGKGAAGDANVLPVLYLKSDVVMNGNGSFDNPFIIK